MTKLLRMLVGLAALVVIIGFAIANREIIEVGLAPLPTKVDLPVYAVFLLGLTIGVLVGGIGVWLGGHRKRRDARRMRHRASALENEVKVLTRNADQERSKRYDAGRALAAQGGD